MDIPEQPSDYLDDDNPSRFFLLRWIDASLGRLRRQENVPMQDAEANRSNRSSFFAGPAQPDEEADPFKAYHNEDKRSLRSEYYVSAARASVHPVTI
ncbi:hypothetical protein L204_100326 [Cryptococcus depauperatus]|nr:hypothetical protein L204_02190 [Cryptococcus depauperatus CBS 7855]